MPPKSLGSSGVDELGVSARTGLVYSRGLYALGVVMTAFAPSSSVYGFDWHQDF
jgi:hypothetical protein